jgi:hypothetical protein
MSGARMELAGETAGVAGLILGRAQAIVEFADRQPKMAFESGIEPVALEMRLALAEGALGRLAAHSRTRGLSGPKMGDLGVLDRMSRLQSEAARRLGQYEAALEEASSPSLGRALETVVSIASGLAVLASAF